ncbi:NEP1-interacting protein-like 1 [Salvia miltiorrhiza]|uniref:NEP1-interacting protein-like 1 n=1 Tax=Salvia miltiorrhiza TaxID=226208 RepID=UPI0025ABC7AE|nr:NEP1-interacting protein-like 1 [Salvia miltiorrhiza]
MLICYQAMKRWASAAAPWIHTELSRSQFVFVFALLKKFAVALLTCIFALGGAIVGVISGALKGQTTETGLLRGVGVGAVAGAITAVQLMELILNGEPFSKAALICSLVNGKIFMEWVSPAVLKAYQWQISTMETGLREISDIFEVNTIRGLSQDTIKELPSFEFNTAETAATCSDTSCAICLQDLRDGESTRLLPSCRHFFHIHCIDQWLSRQATCPVCRKDV